jgi:glycosyltransferase involved in cell wall biosynthesis
MLNQWAFRYRRWKKLPIWHLFQRRVVGDAACLIFTSEEERQQSQALVNHHRTTVVAFGLEGLQAPLKDVPPGSFRTQLDLDDEVPLLAFVGRIHPVKGLGVLLEAVQRAAKNVSGLQIVIAGPDDHGHQARLQQHAVRLGIADRVHWVGVVAGCEKWALLQDADLFMLVSFSENLGLAAVEAMAAGKAVVLGEGVNISSLVKRYGAGWVVPTEKVAIAEAICEAFSNPGLRRARAETARKLVAEQFDPDVNARKTLEVYRESLEQNVGKGTRMRV